MFMEHANDTNYKMFGSLVNLIYSLDLQFTVTIKFRTLDKPSGLDPVQLSKLYMFYCTQPACSTPSERCTVHSAHYLVQAATCVCICFHDLFDLINLLFGIFAESGN